MMPKQGDVALLNDPLAQELLQSTIPARLAYVCPDGSPRVVPIWFHWDGEELVFGGPPGAPKLDMLRENPQVAVTIDTMEWPYKVLMMRGNADVKIVDGVYPEYALAAERYLGEEAGKGWTQQFGGMFSETGRVSMRPEWVGILDFEQRFPQAIANAMSG